MKRTHIATPLLALVAGLALPLAGCESTERADHTDSRMIPESLSLARQAPKKYDASANPVTKSLPITDAIYASASRGPAMIQRMTLEAGARELADGAPGFDETGSPGSRVMRVRYEAEQANVAEVLAVLITDFLERDYIMPPSINQQVNLSIDEEMTVEELERFVAGLCTLYGLSMSEEDGRYTIAARAGQQTAGGVPVTAPIFTAEPLVGNELPAIRLRKLRYGQPADIKSVLEKVMSEGALVSTSGQMLVLVDSARQIKRVSDIVAALDVPAFAGTEMRLYKLESMDAAQAVQTLNSLTTSIGLSGQASALSFLDMPGDGQILMIAKDPTIVRQGENMIHLVDRPVDSPARGRYIYTAQNTSATSLVQAFQQYFPDRMETSTSDPNDTGVRFVPFSRDATAGGISSGAGGAALGASGARTLLIYATPRDYEDMLTLFAELDRPPKQVNMRIVFAEVGLTDDLAFGVEYFLSATDENGNGDGFGSLDLLGTPGGVANPTGSLIFSATDGFAVLEALDSVADTRLISSPNISAVSGEFASINVGGEEPIPAGDTITSGGNVTDNIERRETGITVEAQPIINESGEIRIQLNIDIADLGPDRGDLGPSFTTRIVETNILTKHGQTFLIGGIIIDNTMNNRSQIPGLGDIPILGAAFGRQSDSAERTELLIAVTTTIADTPDDADGFLSEFMRSTHAVREMLTKREESLAQGFLFNRVELDGAPETTAVVDTAPPATPEIVPIEDTLPPFIKQILEMPEASEPPATAEPTEQGG